MLLDPEFPLECAHCKVVSYEANSCNHSIGFEYHQSEQCMEILYIVFYIEKHLIIVLIQKALHVHFKRTLFVLRLNLCLYSQLLWRKLKWIYIFPIFSHCQMLKVNFEWVLEAFEVLGFGFHSCFGIGSWCVIPWGERSEWYRLLSSHGNKDRS